MTDFRSLYDSKFLYAHDLKGRDCAVTIKAVKAVKLHSVDKDKPEQKKPAIWFVESHDDRALVLCKTNARIIAGMFGNDVDDWVGKRIVLFPARVEAFGSVVDAIRIRPTAPAKNVKSGAFVEVPHIAPPEAPDQAEVNEPAPNEYPEGSEA